MNSRTLASLMMDGLNTVKVTFTEGGKVYTYKTFDDHEIGDFVVVKVIDKLKIVCIVGIDAVPDLIVNSSINYKWIVQKVDMTAYENLVEMENKLSDNLKIIEQKSVKANAKLALAEMLKVSVDDVDEQLKLTMEGNNSEKSTDL